ncbi:Mg/Co/Ni transporter MgtE [Natronocella acetinitrilica]|uniref:Mg/Co/Ni transporter MgtE n=1 Tax=Natronocella acetinitrilica TaxID=414046 RepID=A0AAE3G6S9_9GAMM|nr:hypothetical protein [Natronocella acetinitrilica]MCP1676719.1 Mg/Co/Ni transporter MgtE [Natronocella acetinitrilica]
MIDSRQSIRLLREYIQMRRWSAVATQMDLLHVEAVARAISGLERSLLRGAFAQLPYQRRSAVFAHLDPASQAGVLSSVGQDRARRIVRGLLPEHRQALDGRLMAEALSVPQGQRAGVMRREA